METGSQVYVVLSWKICHKIVIQIENYYCTKEKNLAQHQTSVVSQLQFVERILKYEVSLLLSLTHSHICAPTHTHTQNFMHSYGWFHMEGDNLFEIVKI